MDRGQLADALFTIVNDTSDLAELPQRLCTACLSAVPVDGVGLALMAGNQVGGRAFLGATDLLGARIEQLQFDLGEGPCVTAFEDGQPVLVTDLRARDAGVRWPMFVHELRKTPVRALFAFPLRLGAIRIGALDCYRTRPGPLVEPAAALMVAQAVTAALLRVQVREADREHETGEFPWEAKPGLVDLAIRHHAQVHQATGMVAARLEIGLEEAFVRLRAYAFRLGRSLDEVGADVVAGRMPLDILDKP
ncbi:GAF and ANTAR domain-containing protein [Allokutzneria albata]|uniref:GAF domain-containing protein n=1 Tax=Allokutzneria albata TaxID=211114 RepID=A0A1G9TJL0_ALLAB|nr:GAF and ANTAR domain-containing protein [Allokutzneria albata]SDM47901.1 GAF domain-containing protein [Allokutzneria albata]